PPTATRTPRRGSAAHAHGPDSPSRQRAPRRRRAGVRRRAAARRRGGAVAAGGGDARWRASLRRDRGRTHRQRRPGAAGRTGRAYRRRCRRRRRAAGPGRAARRVPAGADAGLRGVMRGRADARARILSFPPIHASPAPMTRPAALRALLCASLILTLAACASQSGVRDDAPPPPVGAVQAADAPGAADVPGPAPAGQADADIAAAMPADPQPQATVPDAATGAQADDLPTQAELDYAAIYGEPPYDPVYDDTLPAPAQLPKSYDPWEGMNRRVHRFNNAVDRTIAKPLAKAYVRVVPRPVRLGVSNFFHNLGQPVSALNALLQGKPKQAAQSLGRFVVNSTLGIGGIFDPASDAKLPNKSEDFGQTLGVW